MKEIIMFLGAIGIIVIAIIIALAVLAVYGCCKVSGWMSRQEEKEEELQNQNTVLSDLEKETVSYIKQQIKREE